MNFPDWESYPELKKVQVVTWKESSGPFLTGLRNPVIVLPEQTWSQEQFSYVLKHELLHCRYQDLFWKMLIDLLCTLFWCNPLFKYLKREVFQLIEMKNDQRLTRTMNQEERENYVGCLVHTAENLGRKDQSFEISFSKNDMRELKQRISFVMKAGKQRRIAKVVIMVLLLSTVFATTCFILEPRHQRPATAANEGWLDEKNTYLIHNGDHYDVYVNVPDGKWKYLFSDERRDNFSRKVKVYEEGEKIDEKN